MARTPKGVHPCPEYAFKPGNQAHKHPPGFRALKTLTRKELADVANVMLKGDMEGLRNAVHDPKTPALIATIASILIKMHATGDMDAFDKLLNRIIGKVRDEVFHGGSIGGTVGSTVVVTLPSNGREVRAPAKGAS